MSEPDVDEVIASANNLLLSIYRDLRMSPISRVGRGRAQGRTSLTVSPEVQREINNIDRHIQEIPSVIEEAGASSVEPVLENSVQIVNATNATDATVTPRTQRNPVRNVADAPIDIIDLCVNSPDNGDDVIVLPSTRPIGLPDVVDLVSPVNNARIASRSTLRRRRSRLPNDVIETRISPRSRSRDRGVQKTENTSVPEMICPICMEPYAKRKPTTTPCGHIFCKNCISESIRLRPQCPICRGKIKARSLIQLHL